MLDKRLLKFAREGRKDATHTEKMLWRALRDRRQDGLKFRRQAVIGEYIADFYCAEHRLIVEVDGDIHDLESVQRHDVFRQQTLEMAGYRVVLLLVENPHPQPLSLSGRARGAKRKYG